MGTGNRLHPEMLEISDLFKTTVDPLARKMRHVLKARASANSPWSTRQKIR